MKSIVLRTMLVLMALVAGSDALAADGAGGGVFLDGRFGGTFGGSGVGNDNSETAGGADGGYLWNLDEARSLGFEVGYTHFGKLDDESGNSGRFQVSASAISAGGHFEYLFGVDKAMVFQARAGLTRVKFVDDFTTFFPSSSSGTDTSHESGMYFGFGVGRKFTQDFSLTLAYDHYSTNGSRPGGQANVDLGWIGLIAEYRF